MKRDELQHYLLRHIPLSAAMQVRVISAGADAVTLGAPLAPNINHRDTVFGGSASALAILAAWSLVHLRLLAHGGHWRIVIQHNTTDYTAPMAGDFAARAHIADNDGWNRFARLLQRRGRARVTVPAVLTCGGEPTGRFEGVFVALR